MTEKERGIKLEKLGEALGQYLALASPQAKEILAGWLEGQTRQLRRELLTRQEEESMNWLRICRDAQVKPLGFYFHAQTVAAQGVNLVHLDAMHWIEPLAHPLPREFFWEASLRPRRYNGEILNLDSRYFSAYQNDELWSKWQSGRPLKLSPTGYLSLALGYPFYGLSIGDWSNGLDGQEAELRQRKREAAETAEKKENKA